MDWKRFDGGNFCVVNRPDYPAKLVEANHAEAQKLYDKAFRNRYLLSSKGPLEALDFKSPKEIIVFRCSRMWQVEGVIKTLKEKFPKSRISVLGQNNVEEDFLRNSQIDEAFFYGPGFFKARTFPSGLMNQLKDRRFDLGVIPYNNMTGNGYGEVRAIGLQMNLPKLIGVNMENKIFDLSNGKVGMN